MGKITTPVPFFTEDIVIDVLSCTRDDHINRQLSLREFADGQMIGLEVIEGEGEMICRRADGAFIQGPEVI